MVLISLFRPSLIKFIISHLNLLMNGPSMIKAKKKCETKAPNWGPLNHESMKEGTLKIEGDFDIILWMPRPLAIEYFDQTSLNRGSRF
jgi:hypothetical protein